jgi:hypothetical protein
MFNMRLIFVRLINDLVITTKSFNCSFAKYSKCFKGKLGFYDSGGEIIRSNQIRLLMVDMTHFRIWALHFA